MFKKILLSVDGSDHSLRAAEKAIELASLSGAGSIDLLHVVAGNTSKSDVLHHGDSDSASRKRMEKLAPIEGLIENAGLSVNTEVLHGQNGIAEAVVQHANDNEYDILILGSRGLSTVQTMVLGSVSHKVMKHVKAPVLMVK
ncbi:universal stress protein [Salisediminibacterium halotolerans]|uniref:Nucleotide-binding universal stress protein, UspA family n=1 Tax=Salisediminibacterium halotolerans TaxID=517425 RepID=A0A1H9SLA1_9BACI|nr:MULTISPECIES: universal stress protein [Salisediminibacterium]RLJ73258.1 nucleotide-binding universal stress UspA family protein [Actinophytocola xinjiangensis]RPE86680.1 nucleotide-binding universal stress UspA family protein [Salisediminibacterium halotolerans]TWG34055.1 nucleotide-binding universal stress UspA family protein [Salisediminibacterium halotolerans]SER85678.1 Nucleotide-binding universal stress protein, UspA family [Salisediminibacterium haloalkalitolerans]GEL08902.1 universa